MVTTRYGLNSRKASSRWMARTPLGELGEIGDRKCCRPGGPDLVPPTGVNGLLVAIRQLLSSEENRNSPTQVDVATKLGISPVSLLLFSLGSQEGVSSSDYFLPEMNAA